MGNLTLGWSQSSPLRSVCTAGDAGVLQSCQHCPPPYMCLQTLHSRSDQVPPYPNHDMKLYIHCLQVKTTRTLSPETFR